MPLKLSDKQRRTILSNGRKILEGLHVKIPLYNSLITISQEVALHRLRKLVKKSTPINEKPSGKKIIFNNVHGTYLEAIYKEGGIAKALQLRGNDVKMLLCGNILTACTGLFTENVPPNKGMCRNCKHFSRNFFEIIGLPYASYFNYLNEKDFLHIKNMVNNMTEEECLNFMYKDVNVGFHTKNSVLRFYKGGDPKESKYPYDFILRARLTNAVIATEVAEQVFKTEKPDILITSHGCYSSWGSFAEYFMNHGIRTRVWYTGIKKNTLNFDTDKLDSYFKIYYAMRKKQPLNDEEEKELMRFLNTRRVGGEEFRDTHYFGFSKDNEDFKKHFQFDKFDKTYALFPNIPWDVSLVKANKAFKDVYDWVSYTIELFKEKPNLQLIIKIHPAETKYHESKKTVLDFINETFIHLSNNITIIPPDTTIAPYSLFPFIDVGIVYNGTIGMEMALNDIPVVVAGKIHYAGKGYTYDINDKEEYPRVLFENTFPNLTKDKKDLLKVYAYYLFIKSYIPFNILYYKSFLNHGWNINSLDDLAEGRDRYLDHICNYITTNDIYQGW